MQVLRKYYFHNKIKVIINMGKRKIFKQAAEVTENKVSKFSAPSESASKLHRKLFDISSYDLANFLLGKLLIRKLDNGDILKGRIVETELYPGGEDQASITYKNRRTPANEALYMTAGTAFVYMTYGMYHCFNISSGESGGAVLLRSLEPIQGIDKMQELRSIKRKKKGSPLKEYELCNGPSKLCVSMDIRKDNCNKLDLCESNTLWIETDPDFHNNATVIKTTRIGIDRAGAEWANKLFRFYILGSESVSKKDVRAENVNIL